VKIRSPKAEVRTRRDRNQREEGDHEIHEIHERGVFLWVSCISRLWIPLALAAGVDALGADSNAAAEQIPTLRPPHPDIPPTFWEQHSLAVLLSAVLFLALLGVGVWFLTRPKSSIPIPSDVQARRELEPLKQQPEDGLLLSRVSQILRRYVACAFALPPGERTTAEFCSAVTGHQQIGTELASALAAFLRRCDELKFSPLPPAPPLGAVEQALRLIEQAEARRAQGRKNEE
jgi:hypothetical protein